MKIFHNENDIPALVERYCKRYDDCGDLFIYHKRNLNFYRKQLEGVEQKLIKLIQKFN